ncbi:MAG: nitrogen regulation protein NR(II) [Mariprofundaceae bacterium]
MIERIINRFRAGTLAAQPIRLILYRSVAAGLIVAFTAHFYFDALTATQQDLLITALSALVLFLLLQIYVSRTYIPMPVQAAIQLGTDVLLVGLLIFATGGVQSPFSFLLGLIIVAAGTQAHALLAIMLSVVACISYLVSIYSYSWWQQAHLPVADTLHILLQTSALMLVGGVMAAIARRHARLQDTSRRAIRQHRQLKELHDQVMASMQEGVIILDGTLHVQDANLAATRMFAETDEITGMSVSTLLSGLSDLSAFLQAAPQTPFQCEWTRGARVHLITAARLTGGDDLATWLLTLVDISDIRNLEHKLVEQEKMAALGSMAAMLAHEIRNPIQTISQAVELMAVKERAKNGDIQSIISEEMQRLNRLVSDMLDYAQPLQPEPVETHMPALIGAAIQQIDFHNKYAIQWSSEMENLLIDPDHFRLVLDNLLRNAITSNDTPGTVSVALSEIAGDGQQPAWQLLVSDQGGGVPDHMKGKLFKPFVSGRTDGIGLGLATVWQVCQANGWNVDVDSDQQGSHFKVSGSIMHGRMTVGEQHG